MEAASRREAEVLELVGCHLSNREIAGRLYISVRTVESHVAALVRKLGVADRRALVALASERTSSATGAPAVNSSGEPTTATRTFLFTEVGRSAWLWTSDPVETARQIQAVGQVIASAAEAHAGRVFKTTGDGTCSVFSSAPQALLTAITAQRALAVPTRMAVHTGEAIEHGGNLLGTALSRCAGLVDAAHGGQVLVSAAAAQVVSDSLGPGVSLKRLGEHRLPGLAGAEPVFQLLADGLPSDFPPLRTPRVARNNLPASRSSFIGRKAERDRLRQMLLTEALVTLTGVGGCGKTRLALESASDALAQFDNGVFFVDLSAVADPMLVGQAVAGALGLQMPDTTPAALADYFAERETLLILDNCEHLLDACADLTDALVGQRCPRLRILATSREPLGVDGEQVLPVPSLTIEAEAVALFADRARDARPGLRVDLAGEGTIGEICRRLDGIPLAIELAAARAAHMAPAEILERLDDRFRFLVGGRRRIQRHQTLAATLDWSYHLLSPGEQQLLRRLAVFRGSFPLRAAEAIGHAQALDLLGSLVSRSLVSIEDHIAAVRYRLLESVRLYAEDKLAASAESEQVRSAHRDWYLAWIESLPLESFRGVKGSSTLLPEADNLLAALEWCRQQSRYDLCARIADRMRWYWFSYARLAEMLAWWRELERGLPADDREHRAMSLLVRCTAAFQVGDWEELDTRSREALALADPESWIAVEALYFQAMYASWTDPSRTERVFEQARRIERKIGIAPDPTAYHAYQQARIRQAASQEEVLTILAEWLAGLRGAPPSPLLAGLLALHGDVNTAVGLLAQIKSAPTAIGTCIYESAAAIVASAQGHFAEALEHAATLTDVVRDYAVPYGEATCAIVLAKVGFDRGDYPQASRLLAALMASAGPGGIPYRLLFDGIVYDHTREALHSVLDPDMARTCQAEGAAIAPSQAIDAALRGAPRQ